MTDQVRDLTSLDAAFNLPETAVSDENLRQLYEVLVHRMREEAKGLALLTSHFMLIERIAATYVFIKEKEAMGTAEISSTAMKDINAQLLAMTTQLQKVMKNGADVDQRMQIFSEVSQIVAGVIKDVASGDVELQRKMAIAMTKKFQEAGMA